MMVLMSTHIMYKGETLVLEVGIGARVLFSAPSFKTGSRLDPLMLVSHCNCVVFVLSSLAYVVVIVSACVGPPPWV